MNHEYSDYEQLIYKVFNSPHGGLLLEMLLNQHVIVPIVQEDGIIPSALRQGKSDLIRQFVGITKRIKSETV